MKKLNIGNELIEFEQETIDSRYRLLKISENKISFLKEGKPVHGTFVRSGNSTYIDLEGMTFEVSSGASRKKAGAVAGDATRLVAPMPGKVFKILKSSGETVKAGEGIIVLEAMKMEHTLKALKDCKVGKIHFQEGEQVTSGAELVHLEIQE